MPVSTKKTVKVFVPHLSLSTMIIPMLAFSVSLPTKSYYTFPSVKINHRCESFLSHLLHWQNKSSFFPWDNTFQIDSFYLPWEIPSTHVSSTKLYTFFLFYPLRKYISVLQALSLTCSRSLFSPFPLYAVPLIPSSWWSPHSLIFSDFHRWDLDSPHLL